MVRSWLGLLSLLLACAASPSHAQEAEFQAVLRDYETVDRAADPIGAGSRGDAQALRLWPDVSAASAAARQREMIDLRDRLRGIATAGLSPATMLDHGLLTNRLDLAVEAFAFDEARIPFISGDGFFTTPDYLAFSTTLRSDADAEAWIERLRGVEAYYAANIVNLRRGLETGFTQPQLTTLKAIESIRGQLAPPAERSGLLTPLRALPASIPMARQEEYRLTALHLISSRIRPAQQALIEFLEHEYLPRTRSSVGISEVPQGAAYYQHLIRRHTTTRLNAAEIHRMGEDEIARIRSEMERVKEAAGFAGTLPEFLVFLRTDRQFFAPTVEAYTHFAAEIAKRIDMEVPRLIGRMPRLTFGLRQLPPEVGNSSAGYWQGDVAAGQAASILIHGERVLNFPLFQLPAWVAHEGVPGHHTQIALAKELEGVSDFRRGENITAYVEGWALYAETLAEEMGLYRTPYERFGRLSYEAWRASRLVVDTGLHAMNWPRGRAVAYLRENTALSDVEINNEIDRYIAWPGQALAYKIGELTIRRLRRESEAALGPRFDVRAFHDAILAHGPMTLEMLEAHMGRWVAGR